MTYDSDERMFVVDERMVVLFYHDLGDNASVRDLKIQEQIDINEAGGIDNLDNKINSIKESDWGKYNIPPPK